MYCVKNIYFIFNVGKSNKHNIANYKDIFIISWNISCKKYAINVYNYLILILHKYIKIEDKNYAKIKK